MWTSLDSWIVVTSALISVACVLPGCFLYLSRQSMMSHGIAHAVLPGIVIGHLISGQVDTPALFVGAIVSGVFCALLTRFLQRLSGVEEGAALGISFTTLFALGLVMQRLFADGVHIEPSHVLMGNLETAIFETSRSGAIPDAAIRGGVAVMLNTVFTLFFFKELKMSTFDPAHSNTVSARPELMYYLLIIVSAITCVVAFEAVGSILVVAMVIIPPAIASLLTKNLKVMIILSVIIAVMGSIFGHLFSIRIFGKIALLFDLDSVGSTNTAGGITLVLGLILSIMVVCRTVNLKRATAPLIRESGSPKKG